MMEIKWTGPNSAILSRDNVAVHCDHIREALAPDEKLTDKGIFERFVAYARQRIWGYSSWDIDVPQ